MYKAASEEYHKSTNPHLTRKCDSSPRESVHRHPWYNQRLADRWLPPHNNARKAAAVHLGTRPPAQTWNLLSLSEQGKPMSSYVCTSLTVWLSQNAATCPERDPSLSTLHAPSSCRGFCTAGGRLECGRTLAPFPSLLPFPKLHVVPYDPASWREFHQTTQVLQKCQYSCL